MNPSVASHIQSVSHEIQYSRQIHKLADALIYALSIPSGSALVPFLAPLHHSNNHSAVAYWIRQELLDPDIELSRHCIEVLLPRLERRLSDAVEVV